MLTDIVINFVYGSYNLPYSIILMKLVYMFSFVDKHFKAYSKKKL